MWDLELSASLLASSQNTPKDDYQCGTGSTALRKNPSLVKKIRKEETKKYIDKWASSQEKENRSAFFAFELHYTSQK